MGQDKAHGAVWQTVRAHDPDRYLASLFVPPAAREALMALYAFNVDIARIPEAVSEPMLGEVRLQWWRDALEMLAKGDATGNPVADALGSAMRDFALPKPLLQGAIDARAFDLAGDPMPDIQAFKAYVQKTQGALFTLAVTIVTGAQPDRDMGAVARDAGFAWGLTRSLRLLPAHLARGRLYLPASHFRDHDADSQALFSGIADENAQAALAGLRNEAREAFDSARGGVSGGNRKAALAFLPCALVPLYLTALEEQAAAPLQGVVEIGPVRRLSRLTWAALRGRLE